MANQQMDLAVGVSVVGEKATRDALNRIGRAVKDTGKEIEQGVGKTEVFKELTGELGKLQSLAGPAAGELGALASAFTTLASGAAGAITGIVAATGALAALAVHGAEAAAKVEEGAKRAGTTGENYQGLAYAFQQTGSSAEGMEKALSKISEAQGKALESADDYDEMAKQIQKNNADMASSARDYASEVSRINSNLFESQRSTALNASEEIRRVRMQANKEASRDAKGAQRIQQDANDRVAEIQRAAAIRQREEQRRANIERQRLQAEQSRRELEQLHKYYKDIEDAAEKAAQGTNKFHKMGVALLDATGRARDTIEVYKDLAEKISQIENPADRAAKAIEVFGRRVGAGLTPNLEKGRAGIDAFFKEAQRLGIILSDTDLKIGKAFSESFGKLGSIIGGTIAKIGLALAPLFQKITDALSEAFGKVQPYVLAAANVIGKLLTPAITVAVDLINGLGTAVAAVGHALIGAFKFMADAINEAFGTNVTDGQVAAFSAALLGIGPIISGLALLLTGPAGWVAALGLAGVAIYEFRDKIAEVWRDNAPAWLQDLVSLLGKVAQYLGPFLIAAAEEFFKDFLAGIKAISAAIQFVYDKLKALANLLGSTGVSTPDAAPGAGFAGGGSVHGPGGIDQVPARLTAGEYVVNKTAADRHRPMLDAINHGKGYALGGLVESIGRFTTPAPLAFAAGGSVPAGGDMVRVDLSHNGKIFPVRAGRQIVDALVDHAKGAQMSSGGVKPSWYGGRAGG